MSISMWGVWAFLLIAQNFSFTYVSRARNSGSLARHIKAAIFSNGIWFLSQAIAVGQFLKIISGEYGIGQAIFAGLFYTSFTITGSVWAHYQSMKSEKGKAAVGASKHYAQIPTEEYELLKPVIAREKELKQFWETNRVEN